MQKPNLNRTLSLTALFLGICSLMVASRMDRTDARFRASKTVVTNWPYSRVRTAPFPSPLPSPQGEGIFFSASGQSRATGVFRARGMVLHLPEGVGGGEGNRGRLNSTHVEVLATGSGSLSLRDKVINAAQRLAEQDYSWTLAVEGAPIEPVGPFPGTRRAPTMSRGKTIKDGFTLVSWSSRGGATGRRGDPNRAGVTGRPGSLGARVPGGEAVILDNKAAFKYEGSGAWQSFDELGETDEGLRVIGPALRFLRFKSPATQAVDLAAKARELTEADEVISGELPEEEAEQVLPPSGRASRRVPTDGSAAKVTVEFHQPDLSGKLLVKFWVKDGLLTKYQYQGLFKGRFPSPGAPPRTIPPTFEERTFNRITTIEISDVGTTEVSVPEEAKKKLSSDD